MQASTRERKRAADREAQRINRARTKEYIEQLERTIESFVGQNGSQLVEENYRKQRKQLSDLQGTLKKIARIADNAANQETVPSPDESAEGSKSQSVQRKLSPYNYLGESDAPSSSITGYIPAPQTSLHPDDFFGMDFNCSDRERNYLLMLGSAFNLIGGSSGYNVFAGTSPTADDDLCIRAVVDGWDAAKDRHSFDPGWRLLFAVDQGLIYRADASTRVAMLRIMRSLLLQKSGSNYGVQSAVPEYMRASHIQTTIPHAPFLDYFPLPQFRDYWILEGIDYASESCAVEFITRIHFAWPFEIRDVFLKEVSTGNYLFSHEFSKRYHDPECWDFNNLRVPMQLLNSNPTTIDPQLGTADDLLSFFEPGIEEI
ncbi:hypothetical protein P170DRAFT_480036 [Aspergillus steynii IBT 23096]|uniref:BZIP domain-containing protein n=1 Tax=Aspergillus steynii IBT 23096 TaxID=1392250 RepID=A0A2I2FUG8_9EURO|nr:uncharacterized protein P170DRAFT_480036 [Aspergillus steynii IBT 23096]PLB44272.1 hypothetical protein P170DRAFT_480036 [Aspergillus steynii IBT 23096]